MVRKKLFTFQNSNLHLDERKKIYKDKLLKRFNKTEKKLSLVESKTV